MLQFGIKDLVLRGDFTACSSELENSYGMGIERLMSTFDTNNDGIIDESERAAMARYQQTFLAGAGIFTADEVEVWSVE